MNQPYREADVPDFALALEERSEVGAFVSRHRVPFPKRSLGIALGTAASLIGLVWSLGFDPTLVLLPFATVFLLTVVLYSLELLGFDLDVHEHGLVAHRIGRPALEMSFDDVDVILYESLHRRQPSADDDGIGVVLVSRDGRRLRIPSRLEGNADVVRTVAQNCVRPLFTQALSAMSSGECLSFGPIDLNAEGVYVDRELLPWDEIERVDVEETGLAFHGKETHRIEAERVPHAKLLVSLLKRRVPVG